MEIIKADLNWAGSLAKRSTIDMIVLHHASAKNCTIYNIHSWHLANGWSGVGYHYFINKIIVQHQVMMNMNMKRRKKMMMRIKKMKNKEIKILNFVSHKY